MTKVVLLIIAIGSFQSLQSQNSDLLSGTNPSLPEYPGGLKSFYKFIHQNLIYPKEARLKGIEGEVVAQFIINEQGYIERNSIQVLTGLDCIFRYWDEPKNRQNLAW